MAVILPAQFPRIQGSTLAAAGHRTPTSIDQRSLQRQTHCRCSGEFATRQRLFPKIEALRLREFDLHHRAQETLLNGFPGGPVADRA